MAYDTNSGAKSSAQRQNVIFINISDGRRNVTHIRKDCRYLYETKSKIDLPGKVAVDHIVRRVFLGLNV